MKILTTEESKILNEFMQEYNLNSESNLYRYTSKEYLKESNGKLYLKAKTEPNDMVVDRYHGFWEVFISSEVGQGISFLSNREEEYERSDRVCVVLKLKDVLDQGGLNLYSNIITCLYKSLFLYFT